LTTRGPNGHTKAEAGLKLMERGEEMKDYTTEKAFHLTEGFSYTCKVMLRGVLAQSCNYGNSVL